jgi:hypothetical protein
LAARTNILKFLPAVENHKKKKKYPPLPQYFPRDQYHFAVRPCKVTLSVSHGQQGSTFTAEGQAYAGSYPIPSLCSVASAIKKAIANIGSFIMVFHDVNMHVHILLFMLHSFSPVVPHYPLFDLDLGVG